MAAWVRFKDHTLGYPQIDEQHERVVESLQDLCAAIDLGRPDAETRRLLDAFTRTASVHFSFENQLMRRSEYPESDVHVAEHRRLLEQLAILQGELAAGKVRSCGALAEFAKAWTTEHIQGADRRLAEHLKNLA
jgi:hemerythrin